MNQPNRTLIYRVSRNGHVMGEYDIDRVVELLDYGELLWADLYWTKGMAGWAPLSALRGEIAAAKAFPPVASAPAPVASGRRLMQAPPAQVATTQSTTPSVAGWMWIVGGVTLGALVGLLTTHFFPNTLLVDRPVEKIVEKPVEVIRTVDRRVDVPAVLTAEQKMADTFFKRFYDFSERKKGALLFNLSDRVKVVLNFSGPGTHAFSEGLVRAKVESAFRGQGFKVLSDESTDYPFSVVNVNGVFVDVGSTASPPVAGSYGISIAQPVIFVNSYDVAGPAGVVIKGGILPLYDLSGVMYYGSSRYGDIVDGYEKLAQEAAGELRKARDN